MSTVIFLSDRMPGHYFISTAVMDVPFAQVCYLTRNNFNPFICGDGPRGSGLRLRHESVCNIIKNDGIEVQGKIFYWVFTRSVMCIYVGWNFNFGNAAVTFDTAHLQSSYFHRPQSYVEHVPSDEGVAWCLWQPLFC